MVRPTWALVMVFFTFAALAEDSKFLKLNWVNDSHSYAIYIGEDVSSTEVYWRGALRGLEHFDARYGKSPIVFGSLVRAPLTESFILAHPRKTEYVFVYLHGLTDSAFQGKDLARALHRQGHNFVSVRLSGHGSDSSRVNSIGLSDWRGDVDLAVNEAKVFGKKVVLMGLSTGGALAIDRVLRDPTDIAGLVPLAPAVGLQNSLVGFLGDLGLIRPLSYFHPYSGVEKTRQVEVRQISAGTGSLAALYDLQAAIQSKVANMRARHATLNIPTVFVTSDADKMIRKDKVIETQDIFADYWWLNFAQDPSIEHSDMVVPSRLSQMTLRTPRAPLHSTIASDIRYFVHEDERATEILPFSTRQDTNAEFEIMAKIIGAKFLICDSLLAY